MHRQVRDLLEGSTGAATSTLIVALALASTLVGGDYAQLQPRASLLSESSVASAVVESAAYSRPAVVSSVTSVTVMSTCVTRDVADITFNLASLSGRTWLPVADKGHARVLYLKAGAYTQLPESSTTHPGDGHIGGRLPRGTRLIKVSYQGWTSTPAAVGGGCGRA